MKQLLYVLTLALSIGIFTASCGNPTDNKLKGYEWLEGKWKGTETQQIFANITPQYIQIVGEMWNEDMNVDKAEKKDYTIKILHNEFLGDIKGICEKEDFATLYIDETKQSIYWIYDFDQKIYLSKER